MKTTAHVNLRVGGGVADKPRWDRVYDCVWSNSIHTRNTRQEEALYKGTLLCCANGNLPKEDTWGRFSCCHILLLLKKANFCKSAVTFGPEDVRELACVAGVRKGRGRELAVSRPNSPFPFPFYSRRGGRSKEVVVSDV